MEKTTVKSFYAILASLTGLAVLSWIYVAFKRKYDAKDNISEESGENSIQQITASNPCTNPEKTNISDNTHTDLVGSTSSENNILTKENNVETSLGQNNSELFQKQATQTNITRSTFDFPIADKIENDLIGAAILPEQTKVTLSASDSITSFDNKTNISDQIHKKEKEDLSFGIDDNGSYNFQSFEGKDKDEFFIENETNQNPCAGDANDLHHQAIPNSSFMVLSDSEEITNVVSPVELDDEDSLEETDEGKYETEETKTNCTNVSKLDDKENKKNLSEENIDCGLGDSLREEGLDDQEPRLNVFKNTHQGYFLHDVNENIDLSPKLLREKDPIISHKRKNSTETKTNKRISAIFTENAKAAKENNKNNSEKFKSKIPSFSQKSNIITTSKPNFQTNKILVKEDNSQNVKVVKLKSSERCSIIRPTNLRKPTTTNKDNISNNFVKVHANNSHIFTKRKSIKNSNILSKTENKLINKLKYKQVNRKMSCHKPTKIPYKKMENNDVQTPPTSPVSNISCNNLDDSLEDVASAAADLSDSLEELSGILDESPCLDFIVDNDDVDGVEELTDDGERNEFPKDLREKTNFSDEELNFLDEEKEELEVFENDLEKMNNLEEDDNMFDNCDQSFFLEQSENELLLNLAFQNNDIDSFVSLLSRSSISKLQRDQCWRFLEQLSIHPSYLHSFNSHIFFIFSLIEKIISYHHSYPISPLKIIFNLSKQKESILFILAAKTSKIIFRLMLLETREEVLLNWLPLVANLLNYIRQHHVTTHMLWHFCCQQQLYQQQLPQPINKQKHLGDKLSPTLSSSSSSHLESFEEQLLNETLFQVLFGQQSRQMLMDKVYVLTNHANTHLTHLSRCLYTSLGHS